MNKLRFIDTGLRSGRENIAFDAAMLEARKNGDIPNSFRFIHFKPVALVGRHQDVSQELNIDACNQYGVQIGRRITGGGAIYFDEGQLGWALICDKKTLGTPNLGEITQKICEAAADAICKLGVNAKFRPRNDIEVEGRKISGTGGFFDDDILMYQGTVLIDLDPQKMARVLNLPVNKLSHQENKDMSARVTSLKAELGVAPELSEIKAAFIAAFEENLGFSVYEDNINPKEEKLAQKFYDDEIGTDEFVYELNDLGRDALVYYGINKTKGGVVKAFLRKEGPQDERIREVIFTGDFFITPPRVIMDLESALRGTKIEEIDDNIQKFFDEVKDLGLLSIAPQDFATAIKVAEKLA